MFKKTLPSHLLLLLLLLVMGACNKAKLQDRKQDNCAFYYWKTKLDLPQKAAQEADSLGVGHFYIRFFDVDYSPIYGEAVPVGKMDAYPTYATKTPFTPVVFITNSVFEHIDEKASEVLADKLSRKIKQYNAQIVEAMSYRTVENIADYEEQQRLRDSVEIVLMQKVTEIQIDCDWTKTTRERYFQFLKTLKKQLAPHQKLSCTLRLHQFKYRKETGIPPVDRAMLMCYNMDEIKDATSENSIFSAAVAEKYLTEGNYPLQLDIALPIFSWGVLFRNDVFKGILNNLDENDVKNDKNLEPLGNNRFRFKIDAEIGNTYIREGDILRLEQPDKTQIINIIQLINKKIDTKNAKIALFHWDEKLIKNYHENINIYYDSFD